jgi:hypothetical protein
VLSLWSFAYSYKLRTRNSHHNRHRELANMKKRDIINTILLFASDTQTFNGTRVAAQENPKLTLLAGIALIISGLSQMKDLSFYHLHLLYDTVNFTRYSLLRLGIAFR